MRRRYCDDGDDNWGTAIHRGVVKETTKKRARKKNAIRGHFGHGLPASRRLGRETPFV